METCASTVLNSDASENVIYNNPDFRAVSHWHDDLEFILIFEGQMFYDVNGQKTWHDSFELMSDFCRFSQSSREFIYTEELPKIALTAELQSNLW